MPVDTSLNFSDGSSSAKSSFAGAEIGGGGHTINTIFNKGGQNRNSTSSGGGGQSSLFIKIGIAVGIPIIVGIFKNKFSK